MNTVASTSVTSIFRRLLGAARAWLLITMAVLLGSGSGLQGAPDWTNGAGGLWSTGTNWTGNAVPTANIPIIDLAGTYTVTVNNNTNPSNLDLRINSTNGAITLDIVSGGQLNFTREIDLGRAAGATLGSNSLHVNGGLFNATGTTASPVLNIGYVPSNMVSNQVTVTSGTMQVYQNGTGVAIHLGDVATGATYSQNTLLVEGGLLDVKGGISIGGQGAASGAIVQTGGQFNVTGTMSVAPIGAATGTGSFNISGGTFNLTEATPGGGVALLYGTDASGVGSMTVSGSAQVNITNSTKTALLRGQNGTLTMNGGSVTTDRLSTAFGSTTRTFLNLNSGTLSVRNIQVTPAPNTSLLIGDGTGSEMTLKFLPNDAVSPPNSGRQLLAFGLTVNTDGILRGVGSAQTVTFDFSSAPNFTVQNSGVLAPGGEDGSVGKFQFGYAGGNAANLSLTSNSTVVMNLVSVSEFDQILLGATSGTRALTYGGTLELNLLDSFSIGDSFQLFDGFTTESGAFSDITSNNSDYVWEMDYGTGVLMLTDVVPEPSTSTFLIFGAAMTFIIYRRRVRWN